MGGGLIQLTNTGAQDIYLTGNPQITYFKIVYRRHTNFSMESIQNEHQNSNISLGSEAIFQIHRYADLLHDCVLELPISPDMLKDSSPNNIGHAIIQEVSVEIGGQIIDKHCGAWLEVYSELNEPSNDFVLPTTNGSNTIFNSRYQYMSCAGGVINPNIIESYGYGFTWENYCEQRDRLYVPLRFWFNRNIGLALPLIALQYNEVFINILLTNIIGGKFNSDINSHINNIRLYGNYIFLDTDERKRFAQISHEYLIECVSYTSYGSKILDLNFNNPIKEIIWCGADTDINDWGQNGSFVNICDPNSTTWTIEINGVKRFNERNIDYFTNYQPYIYHTNRGIPIDPNGTDFNAIAVYSFALKPEDHQPSGTCNFSKIDKSFLVHNDLQNGATYYYIFAVHYNILRIMSGMGGLAYSN